jgi:hypothetical protein
MTKDLEKLRSVKPTVVVHSAPHRRVECSSQIFQLLIVPGRCHPPFPDGFPDRPGGLGADRRQETHKVVPPAILCASRLEGVAKKIKRDVLAVSSSIVVLAVDDLGLRRMKLQTALLETDHGSLLLRVPLAAAVDDCIRRSARTGPPEKSAASKYRTRSAETSSRAMD